MPKFLNVEVEEAIVHRVIIPNEEVRNVLDEMGFTEHGGEMELYQERYADADRILQVIEREELTQCEALDQIKALAEYVEDGTICFYEA